MTILGYDGKTVTACGNCHAYAVTNAGMCQRYPTFVSRLATEVCAEWTPNDATSQAMSANLIAARLQTPST